MEIQVVAFTERGWELAHSIFDFWLEERIQYRNSKIDVELRSWVKTGFLEKRAIVFVGAMGIAVRSIAPFLENKLVDSPVVVVDELGDHVIPVLSGHVGGANELACRIAQKCDGEAVITTATDLNGVFSVDVFAAKNQLNIMRKDGIADVSGKILKGEKASIFIEGYKYGDGWIWDSEGCKQQLPKELKWMELADLSDCDIVVGENEKNLQKAVLPLKPKLYTLGIGCKKGKLYEDIIKVIEINKIKLKEISYISSIDIKLNEKGIVDLASRNRIEYLTFSAETLRKVRGDFVKSEFVQKQVGVDNVCERAAIAAAGEGAELVMRKRAMNGVTLAVAKRRWRVRFDET